MVYDFCPVVGNMFYPYDIFQFLRCHPLQLLELHPSFTVSWLLLIKNFSPKGFAVGILIFERIDPFNHWKLVPLIIARNQHICRIDASVLPLIIKASSVKARDTTDNLVINLRVRLVKTHLLQLPESEFIGKVPASCRGCFEVFSFLVSFYSIHTVRIVI